ncbi:Glyoxalase/Bleomycin resistance protein/Dioxygenase superfamily [Leptolyngbyaceae cyanobacterium JSC-12]|nr:Glyoxalase/Bleomycin resistance protein/Dioxygenase superfamily [Leptolyngbyaceae cyanobacterium JSC-12]
MPLNHTAALLTIATPNFDRLVEFYTQLLNQAPITCIPNVYAEFRLLGVKLGIFHPKADLQEAGDTGDREDIHHSPFTIHHSLTPPPTHSSTHSLLHPPQPPTPSPFSSLGMSLCLEVENLEGAIAHLTQLGYPPPGEILTASHGREIYAYDPDGNWLILHQNYSANDLKH